MAIEIGNQIPSVMLFYKAASSNENKIVKKL